MSVFPSPARGRSIPPDTPHSILFSLPEWEDNIEIAKGNKILCDTLETTYPRFQVPIFVKQVRHVLLSFWLIFSSRFFLCLASQHNTVGFPIWEWNKMSIISFPQDGGGVLFVCSSTISAIIFQSQGPTYHGGFRHSSDSWNICPPFPRRPGENDHEVLDVRWRRYLIQIGRAMSFTLK
jgi:hypothetical protein